MENDEVIIEIIKKLEKLEKKLEDLNKKILKIEEALRKSNIFIPPSERGLEKVFEKIGEKKESTFTEEHQLKPSIMPFSEEEETTVKEVKEKTAETEIGKPESIRLEEKKKLEIPSVAPKVEEEEETQLQDFQQVEEKIIDIEHEPRDIEFTIGSSLFQRIGLLFIIVSSILVTYWVYSAIILKLSLPIKMTIVFSFGIVVTLIGLHFTNSSLPRWYPESLTSAGIAILFITTAISHYYFDVIDFYEALAILSFIFFVDLFLAKRYRLRGLIIESVIGAILVGFLAAWSFPSYPYSQMYTVALFILIFQKLPSELKASSKILLLSYLVLGSVSILQGVNLFTNSIQPHFTLQIFSLASPLVLYLAFEAREVVNRILNQYISMFLIIINLIIFNSPIEYFLAISTAFVISSMLIHRITESNLSTNYAVTDLFMYILIWIFVTLYQLTSIYLFGKAINLILSYYALALLVFDVIKIRLERDLIVREEEVLLKGFKESLVIVVFYLTCVGIAIALGFFESSIVPFTPIIIYLGLKILGVDEKKNSYFILFFYSLLILSLVNVNALNIAISFVTIFLLMGKDKIVTEAGVESYKLTLMSFISIVVQLRLIFSDIPLLALIPSYLYLALIIRELRGVKLENKYYLIFMASSEYALHYIPIVFLVKYLPYLSASLFLTFIILNHMGLVNEINDYLAFLLPLVLALDSEYFTNVFFNVALLASAIYLGLLFTRFLFLKIRSSKLEFYNLYATAAFSAAISYGVSLSSQYLAILVVFGVVTINFLTGYVSTSHFHQALTTYLYIGAVSFFIKGIEFLGFNITYIIYLYAFFSYLLANILAFNVELTEANMIGYPAAVVILLQNVSIYALVIIIAVPALINLQLLINRKELSKTTLLWKLSKLIYILSVLIASIITIPVFNLSVYAMNLLFIIYLSKNEILDNLESHILPVFSTSFITFLEYYTFGVSPLIIFLAIYLNTILFYKTDWIKHSREIVQFVFPYQITYGYYSLFSTIPNIDTAILATVAALALVVLIYKTNMVIALNHIAALTILGFSQGNTLILSSLLLLYIFTYAIASLRIHPIILLSLLVPTSIFIYRNQAYPVLLAMLGFFYLIFATVYRYLSKESRVGKPVYYRLIEIFVFPFFIYITSYILFAITLTVYGLDIFTWSIGYLVIILVTSFLLDLFQDFKELSNYTLYSSALIIILIVYKYGVMIETTVLTSVTAITTILFGTLTDRPRTRKLGIFEMLGASIKGVADIFLYITISNLSIFLKIALGFLILGIVLIATSYLYLKIYSVKKQVNYKSIELRSRSSRRQVPE